VKLSVRFRILAAGFVLCAIACAQQKVPSSAPVAEKQEKLADLLGRNTPRGTVLGFLKAARNGDDEAAAQYLNTRSKGKTAAALAHQLFVVLDRRLPAKLNELSDRPEGSVPFLTRPDEDLVGRISSESGDVDILLERVQREKNGPIWLFSSKTLKAVPDLFEEVNSVSVETILPDFLVRTQIGHIALFEWLGVFLGIPALYLAASLVSRIVSPWIGRVRRRLRKNPELQDPVFLPIPLRLLVIAGTIRWTLSEISLPLMARQFWSGTAASITIASVIWLLVLLNGWVEDIIRARLERQNKTATQSILRLGRRTIDLLVIFAGMLVGFKYFGINPNAALAGLGVGGIAIALAAQKTLENVIGGISITFDQVVRVGDTLNIGNVIGTVEYVGLRSTRIRTADRTVVSVPNGQLAGVQLENFSARDKFWFHPNLGLRYDTPSETMRAIVSRISDLLTRHSLIDRGSVRARFLRLGPSSLDIEIVAYVFARDWPHFLEVQEELLLEVMEIVESAGAHIALPSQTMYLAAENGLAREWTSRASEMHDTRPAGTHLKAG